MLRGDDAGGDRPAKPERIAHGQHPLADLRLVVGELDVGEVVAVDLENGKVRALVCADQLGFELGAVVHEDGIVAAVLHDVRVGDQVAVLGNEEAGALADAAARLVGVGAAAIILAEVARHSEAAEELLKPRREIVEAFRHAVGDCVHLRLHLHADHRRSHLRDDLGKVGRSLRLDVDGVRERHRAVSNESAGAGSADDAESENAGKQRTTEAPGSRA